MILIDDRYDLEELKKAKEILEANGIQVTRTIKYEDNFACARWNIDDIEDIGNLSILSYANKISFLQYAENQLRSDMIERGWDSLKTLADIFMSDEFDINSEKHDYDVFEIEEDGEEEYINRFFQTTPKKIAEILMEDVENEQWELDKDNDTNFWFWIHDDKNRKAYRIQLFQ